LVSDRNTAAKQESESRILTILAKGPQSYTMLLNEVGQSRRTLTKRLSSLLRQWKIRRIDLSKRLPPTNPLLIATMRARWGPRHQQWRPKLRMPYPRGSPRVWYELALRHRVTHPRLTLLGPRFNEEPIQYWGKPTRLGRALLDKKGRVKRPWPGESTKG
jgi:hypothetical protein